ncbi:LolA family protein [Moheibacter sediminis]|uniref:Outer membrane lipoprotein-sorting protein n=1 Tax=Moheibacter sediminis TaxID=1434700 RepID=A0A1W1ZXK2_9FLAO|nr:hypothetical protein [Moheibacter sediminis]SMC53124.1 Outer membrane lipoprotein-sorting protein [Moheibacter sediminis]
MKKIFFLFSLCISISISAQTAESIINQHLESSGGISKWKGLNSIILKGSVTLGIEESFSMVIYHRRPYEKKVAFIIEGKEVLNEGYDGKNGWTFSEISKKNEKVPGYQPDSFDSDMMEYSKKGFEAQYIGKAKEEGKECYKVVLTKHTNKITYCFSTKDYSLLSEETNEEKTLYFDYKSFDGLQFATKQIGRPKDGGEYVIKFNQIQINPAISDKVFKF